MAHNTAVAGQTKSPFRAIWTGFATPDATTDRGWLKAECDPFDSSRWLEYNDRNMPVWDEDINAWREQSTLGNYLDYGQVRPKSEGPQVHCVCYVSHQSCYVDTVEQAREWIEAEAQRHRPDLSFQRVLI